MSKSNNLKNITGLSQVDVDQKLKEFGLNKLPEQPPPSDLAIFISQLKSPLVYVLLAAGGVTLFLREFADTAIIGLAVFLNTILGFLQERKASKALEALKKLLHPYAKVLRDGKVREIEVEYLVPGDVVYLSQGDKIPADGKIIDYNRFYVTEAILTGESVPVEKKLGGDEKVFMGTIVTGGKAVMSVEMTGDKTEMGKIARSVGEIEQDTPLRRQLAFFSGHLSKLVIFLIVFVFVIGLLSGMNLAEIFTTSVALAVSAIPEGLLVGLTVVLAIGMQRILSRKGLVRNLASAETLGGVTTICVDKTGTLTEGNMKVVDVIGEKEDLANQVIIANDLDDPIVLAAWEWGREIHNHADALREKHERIDSIPFDSETRIFASLNKWDDENNILFVNGAPEVIIERSALSENQKKELLNKIEELSIQGKRILGFARKKVDLNDEHIELEETYKDLEWIGLLAFFDPIRTDVKSAFEQTRKAGIKLMVITGDYAKTAISVMKQIGVDVDEHNVILGEELEKFAEKDLEAKVLSEGNVKLFARTKPHQKLKIVEVLKKNNEVVAMMGDGVNDAPALAKADIGIVVGEATDVAKESSDLVLLDSRFETIIAAIEEGRGIFDNIRKIILYLMSDAFVEISIVLAVLILGIFFEDGLPLPITASQILWINIVSDGFPHLALTVDPKALGIMDRKPRPPLEPLVASWMYKLMGLISVLCGFFAFAIYFYVYQTTGNITLARSATFATVGMNSLVYVFSIRTLTQPFWKEKFFENKWLVFAVFVGVVFQIAPFIFDPLRRFFEIQTLGSIWYLVVLVSILMFFGIEFFKWVFWRKVR